MVTAPHNKRPVRKINLVEDAEEIELIFKRAVHYALWVHKRLGNPIAAWEKGKVVIIPPDEIEIDESLIADLIPPRDRL